MLGLLTVNNWVLLGVSGTGQNGEKSCVHAGVRGPARAPVPVLLFPLKATRPTAQGYNRNAFRLHVSP